MQQRSCCHFRRSACKRQSGPNEPYEKWSKSNDDSSVSLTVHSCLQGRKRDAMRMEKDRSWRVPVISTIGFWRGVGAIGNIFGTGGELTPIRVLLSHFGLILLITLCLGSITSTSASRFFPGPAHPPTTITPASRMHAPLQRFRQFICLVVETDMGSTKTDSGIICSLVKTV